MERNIHLSLNISHGSICWHTRRRNKGFTIVELLIVIVVIAILAVITIVAFNGIQDRARSAAVSSALNQVAKKVKLYSVDNGTYPTALADIGVTDSASASYQYSSTSGSPGTYCVTGTQGNTSLWVSDSSTTPTKGGCAGHGQGGVAAVTNYVLNPEVVGTTNIEFNRPTYASMTTTGGVVKVTVTDASLENGLYIKSSAPTGYFYSAKFKIRANGGAIGKTTRSILHDGTTRSSSGNFTLSSSWQEINVLASTLTSTTRPYLYIYFGGSGWVNGDGIEVTQPTIQRVDAVGQTVPSSFASGDSPNWVWNGTPNNSTSTGPVL